MSSEYEPLFGGTSDGIGGIGGIGGNTGGETADDLDRVRERFARASRPFLRSPWSWLAWAVLMPAAAFATSPVGRTWGPMGVLLLWSGTILMGGAVEALSITRAGSRQPRSPLSAWVLRVQGNTSLLAVVLSLLAIWLDGSWALPGIWLLMLGQSFYLLGGLAFLPFRRYGILLQVAGLLALWPGGSPLATFAVATGLGNLWLAWSVWKVRRSEADGGL